MYSDLELQISFFLLGAIISSVAQYIHYRIKLKKIEAESMAAKREAHDYAVAIGRKLQNRALPRAGPDYRRHLFHRWYLAKFYAYYLSRRMHYLLEALDKQFHPDDLKKIPEIDEARIALIRYQETEPGIHKELPK